MSIDLVVADISSVTPGGKSITSQPRGVGRSMATEPTMREVPSMAESVGDGSVPVADAVASAVETGQGRVVSLATEAQTSDVSAISRSSAPSFAADLVQLTKPRIVVMVLVTTVASGIVAAGGWFAWESLGWLLLGTAMVAGSAGAANQVWERRIDRNMPRTAIRPLPSDRMSVWTAALFTGLIGLLGSWVLASQFGATTAWVGVSTWLMYVLVYTPLKVRTAWNTTVGAVAGALPILIGYSALGGSLWDVTGWLLVGVLVTWQYPHFMAIAWMYRRQYAAAGFHMTTTVEPTGRSASIQSIVGSVALVICGILLCVSPDQVLSSVVSSLMVVAVVFPMLRASLRFARQRDDSQARHLLRSSLLVLPAVLLIVTLRVFW